MNTNTECPKTLQDAIVYFSDQDRCLDFLVELRWPSGVACPRCGSTNVVFMESRRLWQCREKHEKRQFTIKVGTIMEDSPLGLDKWLCAIWMIANDKNGISSYELARALGITQKSAWFLNHRIRLAMQTGTFAKLSGEVEVDETYIGGLACNMHAHRRPRGTGGVGKAVVMGLLERHGEVRTKVVPNIVTRTLQGEVEAQVEKGSTVYTDELSSYRNLADMEYAHKVINHAEAYVQGSVHTNGMENFRSPLKRGIKGTYVSVEPFHLFRYLDEQAFRFNTRKEADADRFRLVAASMPGRRLAYRQLTGEPS